jgi:hypothetical protein
MKQILIEKYIKPSETKIQDNGVIIENWFNEDGDLHSFLGHPAKIYYNDDKVSIQGWYKKSKLYRNRDLPAKIEYTNSETTKQRWNNYNILNRGNDKPALIHYYKNGQIAAIGWFKNDELHREVGKPAVILYYDSKTN